MNDRNVIEFCIAQNLAKALGFEKREDIIWRLFLGMDIMGFEYHGLKSSQYEIFNGLNGTCRDFVDRCFNCFGLLKITVDCKELLCHGHEGDIVIEVDDFYLDYHPYFNKYHHIRQIVLTRIHNDACTIYDMDTYRVKLDMIKQAVVGAFHIGGNQDIMSKIEDITNNLLEYYENWTNSSDCIKSLSLFRKDLEEKNMYLKEADFESLYYFVNKLGGPTQSRKFMNIALTSLLEYVGNHSEKLTRLNHILGNLAYEWDILGNLFFRMSRTYKKGMHERIMKRIDGIVDLEMQLTEL